MDKNNNNGYIGVDGVFNRISKRYIGVDNNWKDQDFKFIGDNGYWRLIYTKDPIDMSADFYVRYLEEYTLERKNSLNIYGKNLKDYQLVSPRIGGYFELERTATDLFENFASGTFNGSPQVSALLGGKKCMKIETPSDYFQLPKDLDAQGVFGTNGQKDYNLSNWFFIPSLSTGTDVIPIISYGDRANGMEIVISFDGRLQQKIWYNYFSYVIQTPVNSINLGWNYYVITRTNNLTKIYLKNSTVPVVTSTQSMPAPLANIPIKVGISFKYTNTIYLPQTFSTTKTAARYTLSNNDRTIKANTAGAGTARTSNKISPNTGKFYFETRIDDIAGGVVWVGLGDAALSQTTAVGIAGWSISSNSRTFNKQTGGGTNWGGGTRTFTTGDTIGCIYDSNSGTAVFYKNNTLLGTSTTSITGDVEFMVAGDINTIATIRIKSSEWIYPCPEPTASEMPETTTYTGLFNYSVPGTGYKYVFVSNSAISNLSITKLLKRTDPDVILLNKSNNIQTIISEKWIPSVTNDFITVTMPETIEYGDYELFVRYFDTVESYRFPLNISEIKLHTEPFTDNFDDSTTLSNNYYAFNRAWGGANGGVVPENVYIKNGELIFRGNGDNYTGTIQGVTREGIKKFHTDTADPNYGQPWKNRVGGCVAYNKRTGFGSYEIDVLIPNQLGCCYAMWTFFYNEIYQGDPRYMQYMGNAYETKEVINVIQSGYTINKIIDDYGIISYGTNYNIGDQFVIDQDASQTVYTCIGIEPGVIYYNPTKVLKAGNTFSKIEITLERSATGNEGLHEQGNLEDGYYITRNHEIDIEFPSHLNGGTLSNPSLSNFKANTWRGELQNWDVATTDPSYWEEYRDNLTPVGFNIADGNYHKLRFDWHPDKVEYYIDGVLKQTNTNSIKGDTIPDISGFFTFGLWFPSSPLAGKPWLVNPQKAWAGGEIDVDGGMKANFDSVEMKVKQFKFTPFTTYSEHQRNEGETYPFNGYINK